MAHRDTASDLHAVLDTFADLDDGSGPVAARSLPVERLAGGLINDTYALGRGFVVQRLHRIFLPEVNLDIAALVPHLRAAGVPVPTLLRARDGKPYVHVDDVHSPHHGTWRILTRLPGATRDRLDHPRQAEAAGAMVGRFHAALLSVAHRFAFVRPGAHDTPAHMASLAHAMAQLRGHRLWPAVAPLADELLARWAVFGPVPDLPARIIHGDLKVSNLLWDGDAVCGVIDLDTMAHSSLDIELGDALRSWCNATAEDAPEPSFDAAVFAAAMGGYLGAAGTWITRAERHAIARGTLRICLELSARFLGDALRESYFGWDARRFASRGDHNLARGRNQLALARTVAEQMPALQTCLEG
ncbi:MAG: phosphotransferase [Deltaproteobacteria bacterium]|nr:phosphotransferase [Deltaproteobacteria bacterium]